MQELLDEINIKFDEPKNYPFRKTVLYQNWEEYIEKDYFLLKIGANSRMKFLEYIMNDIKLKFKEYPYYAPIVVFILLFLIIAGIVTKTIMAFLPHVFYLFAYVIEWFINTFSTGRKWNFFDGKINIFYSSVNKFLIVHQAGKMIMKEQFTLKNVVEFYTEEHPPQWEGKDGPMRNKLKSILHLCVKLKKENNSLPKVENGYKLFHSLEGFSPKTIHSYDDETQDFFYKKNQNELQAIARYLNRVRKNYPYASLEDFEVVNKVDY